MSTITPSVRCRLNATQCVRQRSRTIYTPRLFGYASATSVASSLLIVAIQRHYNVVDAHASWHRCLFAEVHVQIGPFDVQLSSVLRTELTEPVRSLVISVLKKGPKWPRSELTIPRYKASNNYVGTFMRFLNDIIYVYGRITNVEVRARTGQQTMDNILRERRLRWLGHVFRMDHQRIPQQALYWQVPGYKRGPGRPRANWRGVVSKDLRNMGFTWEEAEVAALDRHGLRRSVVAQCVQLDTGWIKVKVKVWKVLLSRRLYQQITPHLLGLYIMIIFIGLVLSTAGISPKELEGVSVQVFTGHAVCQATRRRTLVMEWWKKLTDWNLNPIFTQKMSVCRHELGIEPPPRAIRSTGAVIMAKP